MGLRAISCTSKKHAITASSTYHDELIEFWIVGNKTAGFRNIMPETGMNPDAPTQVYQDNDAAIQIEMNRDSLGSHRRHILGNCLRLRIRLKMGASCLYRSKRI